jgi:uncharacterized LabA/DUF88 family protein
MRVYVYVDGFNLYYRALKGTPHKWLNLEALINLILQPPQKLEKIRYFTARVSARAGDPDAPRRQQLYLNALSTLHCVEIHYGSFLAKKKWRPLVSNPSTFVEILDSEEKGSDVNLAVHLVNDAWADRFDLALVLSQDTDLKEPLRIVTQERGKRVGLVWLDGRQADARMAAVSTFVRNIRPASLRVSQFPDPIPRNLGAPIAKPVSW